MPVRPLAPFIPVKLNDAPRDEASPPLIAWPRRAAAMVLDMGEGSREQGFRLNGSR